jgi:5-methyltetrahydropteroyltriglutamate--homocysteine methyltransferase
LAAGRRDDPRDQGAGLDIITVGEIRRESYSNRFATALEGIDIAHPGTALDRSGHPNPMPRIVAPIRRMHPVEVDDLKFLKRHTGRQVKMTVPGPFTMSQQAQNDFYPNPAEAAMNYAVAVNEEIRDLFAAGADIVQVDEPCMQARHHAAAESNYQRALAVARRQRAKTFELHAASSLARLWRDKGKRIEARDLLAPVYGWFSEGFDSPVLREAKALLDELSS